MNAATPRRLGRAMVFVSAGVVLGVAATRRARHAVSLHRNLARIHEGLAELDVLGRRLDALQAEIGTAARADAKAGPRLATPADVIAGRARYADTAGGHADRKTLAAERSQS